MIPGIAEMLIDLAAVLAGVGGIVFLVYFVHLVWWERHEQRAFLDDYVREHAARRAGYVPEPGLSRTVSTSTSRPTRAHSLQHGR